MAARQAAGDALSKTRSVRKGAPDSATEAAVVAVKTRMRRKDGRLAVGAAAMAARSLADIACGTASGVALMGVPVHAATTAVFEVGIRGAGRHDLQHRIRETCNRLPELARPLGDLGVSMTAALCEMILSATENRRLYRTAVKNAEEACIEETINRIVGMIDENTFEVVYGALAACAHTASGGRAFKSGYEEALAKACGVGTPGTIPDRLSPDDIKDILKDVSPEIASQVCESDLQDFFLQMRAKRDMLLGSVDDTAGRKRLGLARGVDYKKTAADTALAEIISMYRMAYDAGYERARTATRGRR